MKPESNIIGGVELPRWPPFSGAFRKDAQSAAKTYRGLCLARLTLFKSDRLNDRFEELALTQTFNKVTLYHFFYLMIPAGFLGACSVMALGCSSLPVRVVICSAGIGVGVLFAHLLPRFLWHMLGVYERKGWFLMEDDKAVRFFRELAERGSSFAQAALGFRYEHGQGVPKDVHAAFNWYRRSAAQGNLSRCPLDLEAGLPATLTRPPSSRQPNPA